MITYENAMDCAKCNNSGIEVDRAAGTGRVCECDGKRKALIAMNNSGLAGSIDIFRFDNFSTDAGFQKQMYALCRKFTQQRAYPFLYISGQTGCGKTHLGTAVCGHFIEKGEGTLYTTFRLLMNDIKSGVNDEAYARVLRKYGTVPVLYVDDFMKLEPTKADIGHSFELINMRVVLSGITIITSERSIDEIIRIDEALGGRIKQKCGEFEINVEAKEGRNYRLAQRKAGASGNG